MMDGDLLDEDFIFPLHSEEVAAHANEHLLVDIAFECKNDIEVHCFDPTAMISFDWHFFMQCVFRWASHCGIRPISMIGGRLPRQGFDLKEHFRVWVLNLESDEQVTAFS